MLMLAFVDWECAVAGIIKKKNSVCVCMWGGGGGCKK